MVRPFCKADGIKTRPVVVGEALFPIAMATCFGARNAATDRAFGPCPFGARKHDGAGQMIAQVSAALMTAPEEAVVCLDARNALGAVLRSAL